MINRTQFFFICSVGCFLLFAPFFLSAQQSFTASAQLVSKKKTNIIVTPEPEMQQMIDEEEFFWKDDQEELVLPENQVDPNVLNKVENYRNSFLDSESVGEEWVEPGEKPQHE